jgi:RNA polymerase I-specific transcription initiation factor RRN3
MTKEINIQITYVKNLLRSLSYFSIERLRFLEIILSKLLRLDVRHSIFLNPKTLYFPKVHASRQDILREEKSSIESELVFSLEQLDTNDNNGMKHDQADKLDCLMFVVFEYITNTCIENGKRFDLKIKKLKCIYDLGTVNYEATKSLFRDLLNIFNKILLPTHDSSHVQFLLFYICNFHTVNQFFHTKKKDFNGDFSRILAMNL